MHSGQAIGLLAGAVGPGDDGSGLKLFAGQGDVELQAQSDELTLAAKELVKLVSADSHIDFAAAKSIVLCTEGGASLTLEGGNVSFECPGTISMKSGSKEFGGPERNQFLLPVLPNSENTWVDLGEKIKETAGTAYDRLATYSKQRYEDLKKDLNKYVENPDDTFYNWAWRQTVIKEQTDELVSQQVTGVDLACRVPA